MIKLKPKTCTTHTRMWVLACLSSLISACVSYEPAVLAPAVTLSAEEVNLIPMNSSSNALDFGLEVGINESDSLLNIETLPGVRVISVSNNGPAANAGIQAGDTVLAISGIDTNHPDTLSALAQIEPQDSNFTFIVKRNTLVFEATVIARTITSNPVPVSLYRIDPLATRAGYRTELVDLGKNGSIAAARVERIFPLSPLPTAGVSEGDLILALEGSYLNSAQDLVSRLNQEHELGDNIRLTRYRAGELEEIQVRLWDPGRRISRITLGPLLNYETSISPSSESFSLLDLWLFSVYSYTRQNGERSHSLLGLINFSSDVGELIDETN